MRDYCGRLGRAAEEDHVKAEEEEGRQVEALTQFCEILSIGTEDSLNTFSVDSFMFLLVGLNHEGNPDIMLLAAHTLTYLCDMLQSSCAAVVHYGAISWSRLLTIEYMDLAEQVPSVSYFENPEFTKEVKMFE